MKFEDTTWFKLFGNCEYKVTFNDGNDIIITVIEEGSIKKIIVDIEDNEIGELY